MKMAISDIVREVIGGVDPICTIKELASVARVHEQTVYSWKNDHTEPGFTKLQDMAHFLNRRGYHKLSLQFWDNCEGEANGVTQDETCRIICSLGHIEDNPGNPSVIINEAGAIEKEARNLRAEGEAML